MVWKVEAFGMKGIMTKIRGWTCIKLQSGLTAKAGTPVYIKVAAHGDCSRNRPHPQGQAYMQVVRVLYLYDRSSNPRKK